MLQHQCIFESYSSHEFTLNKPKPVNMTYCYHKALGKHIT